MFIKYTKNQYRQAFQQVEGFNDMFLKYASNYDVSIEQSIADRDFPLTRLEILCLLKNITGKWPKNCSIVKCSPDNDDNVKNTRQAEIMEYKSIYG